MPDKSSLFFLPAVLLIAACSTTAPSATCITQSDDSKICSIANPATGLTTRTIERGDRLFVSTCQMSQCSPFEELPAGQKKMEPRENKLWPAREP
jgi:hypothetical protein